MKGLYFEKDLYIGEDTLFFAKAITKSRRIIGLKKNLYNSMIYSNSACHGYYDVRRASELDAWERVNEMYTKNSMGFISSKTMYINTCIKIISQYYDDNTVEKSVFLYAKEGYKHNAKYYIYYYKKYYNADKVYCLKKILKAFFIRYFARIYLKFRN